MATSDADCCATTLAEEEEEKEEEEEEEEEGGGGRRRRRRRSFPLSFLTDVGKTFLISQKLKKIKVYL